MNLWIGLALGLVLSGCARVVAPPPAPPVPVETERPRFEKTFGSIDILPNAGLAIRYKKIALLIDPSAVPAETDYVFLTGAASARWNAATQSGLRKNMKILCSPAVSRSVSAAGFTQVKAVESGQRLLLKKEDGFLFASAASGQSYFLEFDNGKNIFVAGDVGNADTLREFVYALRDDGREIEIGFFRVSTPPKDDELAQLIGLLQPKNVVLVPEPGVASVNPTALKAKLKTEFFEGPIVVAGSDAIVF